MIGVTQMYNAQINVINLLGSLVIYSNKCSQIRIQNTFFYFFFKSKKRRNYFSQIYLKLLVDLLFSSWPLAVTKTIPSYNQSSNFPC